MNVPFSRRALMLLPPALLMCRTAIAAEEEGTPVLQALERRTGARIGVSVLDTGTGRTLRYRENERFLMCSSFKLSLAAAVLKHAEYAPGELERLIRYKQGDLLPVSPATSKNVATGMKIADLCEAAVIYSDNTAANLLLGEIGGPAGVTQFWRNIGDTVSRLDRTEPALNVPDGDKDTTTPLVMMRTLERMLIGPALLDSSRERLVGWMVHNTTGDKMLRAGLPKTWTIGDKTGRYISEKGNAVADLAIATPPGRKPILIASFAMNVAGDDLAQQAAIAEIGGIVGGLLS